MKKIKKFSKSVVCSPKAVVCNPKPVVCSPKSVVHIYTGDGKGKTTAAIGLALRACGAKKRVAILQFMKKGDSSEIKAIKKYKLPVDVFAYGVGFYIPAGIPRIAKQFYGILGDKKPKSEHKKAAEKGLKKAEQIIKSNKYDLIILDEINMVVDLELLDVDAVIDILQKAESEKLKADIVLTGRNAHTKIKKLADLISVIKKQKHYFDKNIPARKGIEF